MNKVVKIILIFLIIDAVILLGYFYFTGRLGGKSKEHAEDVGWVTIDEYYMPKDYVEEFIKSDSSAKGLLPVEIRNFGKSTAMLRKFKGTRFAKPTEAQLKMMFKDIEDWKLVELKYKPKEDREVTQSILYIFMNGDWQVGDRGSFMQ